MSTATRLTILGRNISLGSRRLKKQRSLLSSTGRTLATDVRPTYEVGIIGAPMSKGQLRNGVDRGPDWIRDAGLITSLEDIGLVVTDYGNLSFEDAPDDRPYGRVINPNYVGAALKKVSAQVETILRDEDKTCLLLGGDHSLGAASIHAFNNVYPNNSCHIWVDAHADINTALTTTSGKIHGMPVSFVLRELVNYNPELPGFGWIKPCINANQIAYVGLRDVEPLELYILNKLNIKYFTMKDIDKLGIHRVVEELFNTINPRGDKCVHVSFDIDAIDSSIAPSTGTPVKGGLTRREALIIGEEISATGVLKALDLVEVNPLLGSTEDAKKTVAMAIDVISTFLGQSRPGLAIPKDVSLPKP